MEDQPWLDLENGQGDTHKMDHEMRIGAMGFDEQWISHVTCEKFRQVSVGSSLAMSLPRCGTTKLNLVILQAESNPSGLFKALRTTWTLSPALSNTPHPSSQPLPQGSAPLSNPGQASNKAGPHDDNTGPTLVSIDLAWQFANPLYAAAAGTAFQRVSGKIMGAFEKRAKEIHGNGKQ